MIRGSSHKSQYFYSNKKNSRHIFETPITANLFADDFNI